MSVLDMHATRQRTCNDFYSEGDVRLWSQERELDCIFNLAFLYEQQGAIVAWFCVFNHL